ncbi:MAG TPA: HK97 family phage prohead protease [Verrucomicrobiae bacterium]
MTIPSTIVQPAAISFPRLVDLFDGRRGIRGTLEVEIREPDSASGTLDPAPTPLAAGPAVLDFISSNESLDRYGEIISARGWRLENYRRNPVFQNAHQYGDVIFTLGKALVTEVRGAEGPATAPYLYQRIQFAVDVNPMARIAYGLYRGKFLNAVSVGFIPLRWENPADPEKAGYRRKYLEQELLEVSAVGIPANPEALQLGLEAGAIEKADLRRLFDLIYREEFRSEMAAPNTDASASGGRSNEAQLLQLARALREILRRT